VLHSKNRLSLRPPLALGRKGQERFVGAPKLRDEPTARDRRRLVGADAVHANEHLAVCIRPLTLDLYGAPFAIALPELLSQLDGLMSPVAGLFPMHGLRAVERRHFLLQTIRTSQEPGCVVLGGLLHLVEQRRQRLLLPVERTLELLGATLLVARLPERNYRGPKAEDALRQFERLTRLVLLLPPVFDVALRDPSP
jgi:hypothetical protein